MGNTESGNVTNDVKQQGNDAVNDVYKLVDLNGGGLFVELTKLGRRKKDFSELDEIILSNDFKSLLYNGGGGKKVPLIDILNIRDNKDYRKEPFGLKVKGKADALPKTNTLTNGNFNYLYKKKGKKYLCLM